MILLAKERVKFRLLFILSLICLWSELVFFPFQSQRQVEEESYRWCKSLET